MATKPKKVLIVGVQPFIRAFQRSFEAAEWDVVSSSDFNIEDFSQFSIIVVVEIKTSLTGVFTKLKSPPTTLWVGLYPPDVTVASFHVIPVFSETLVKRATELLESL